MLCAAARSLRQRHGLHRPSAAAWRLTPASPRAARRSARRELGDRQGPGVSVRSVMRYPGGGVGDRRAGRDQLDVRTNRWMRKLLADADLTGLSSSDIPSAFQEVVEQGWSVTGSGARVYSERARSAAGRDRKAAGGGVRQALAQQHPRTFAGGGGGLGGGVVVRHAAAGDRGLLRQAVEVRPGRIGAEIGQSTSPAVRREESLREREALGSSVAGGLGDVRVQDEAPDDARRLGLLGRWLSESASCPQVVVRCPGARHEAGSSGSGENPRSS